MIINLYRFTGDSRLLDKTEHLASVLTLSGTLKSQASIVNPIVTVEFRKGDYFLAIMDSDEAAVDGDGNELGLSETVSDENLIASCDYAEIPQFHRFYYINDVISVREGLWQLSMSCDVLMSFKDQIRELDAMVDRNQYKGNPLLEDDNVSYSQKMEISEQELEIPYPSTFESLSSQSVGAILLTVMVSATRALPSIGDYVTPSGYSSTPVKVLNLPSSYVYLTYVMTAEGAQRILKEVASDANLATFIVSMKLYPKTVYNFIKGTGVYTSIYLGSTEIKLEQAEYASQFDPQSICETYYEASVFDEGSYLQYSPFAEYELYIPYKGVVKLDSQQVVGRTIQLNYVFGLGANQDAVTVESKDSAGNSTLIYSDALQIGIDFPLSSTNAQELKDQMNQLTTNYVLTGIGGALTFGAGVLTGHPLMAMGGLAAVGTSSAKYLTSVGAMHETAKVVTPSGETGFFTPQTPILRTYRKIPSVLPFSNNKVAAEIGRPLKEEMSLSALTGLTICSAVRTDSISGATLQERTEIEKNLLNGVIL